MKKPAEGNLELSSASSLGDVSVNSDLIADNVVGDLKEEETMDMDKIL